jgi:pimeloyl-ACP methyl ester carboxylesterase
MDDFRAVMDAAGLERASIIAVSEAGPMAILFSATYPDRVEKLVLYGTFEHRARPRHRLRAPVRGPRPPHPQGS